MTVFVLIYFSGILYFKSNTYYYYNCYYYSFTFLIFSYYYLINCNSVTVRERFRTHPNEVLPPPHRLAVAQLLVQNSKWLSVDPWEITRRRAMDYLSLLEHTTAMLK